MLERLKEQPTIGKLITQYDQLPRRDQQALTVLAVAVILALLYFAAWRPVTGFADRAAAARENAAELVSWMQANQTAIRGLAGASSNQHAAGVDKPSDGRALMALVTRSARESGLTLQRFEPSGDDAIRVWLDGVSFSGVAAWLEQLNSQHGVVIDQAAMDRGSGPGLVSVRLTLAI